ncbi:MAG: hypothetical protein PHD57_03680, partial [Desulfobacterales bacterium]|nr:hypothetical protein [Desulfobacterales bacterium]
PRGSGLAYDEVCRSLVDPSEACSVHVNRNSFRQELKKFMADHMKRKAVIQLLMKIDIWNEKRCGIGSGADPPSIGPPSIS